MSTTELESPELDALSAPAATSEAEEFRAFLPAPVRTELDELFSTVDLGERTKARRVGDEQKTTIKRIMLLLREYGFGSKEVTERLDATAACISNIMNGTEASLSEEEQLALQTLESQIAEHMSTRIEKARFPLAMQKVIIAALRLARKNGQSGQEWHEKHGLGYAQTGKWTKELAAIATRDLVPDAFPKKIEEEIPPPPVDPRPPEDPERGELPPDGPEEPSKPNLSGGASTEFPQTSAPLEQIIGELRQQVADLSQIVAEVMQQNEMMIDAFAKKHAVTATDSPKQTSTEKSNAPLLPGIAPSIERSEVTIGMGGERMMSIKANVPFLIVPLPESKELQAQ